MSSLAALDEEEMYLLSILDDPSGIDLAEFCWVSEETDDGCFRCWDFQWTLYRSDEIYQIDHMGRSLGKSNGLIMRAFAFPFNYPGFEMLVTAPELNHLKPVTDKIKAKFLNGPRLGREMLPTTRGQGINESPQFQVTFANKAHIVSRIPQRSGIGVKGMHPLVIELDEGQDYPEAGWDELVETMKSDAIGAHWRVHGVSRGVRDRFYKYTMKLDPNMPWYVHRYMAMHRRSWGQEERSAKISLYGGTRDNVNYRRNIYGDHGDVSNPLFVLHRLMECVRIAESSWAQTYNDEVYQQIKVTDDLLSTSGAPIGSFLQLPEVIRDNVYTSFWGGMDVGYTRDPSELLIFGELPHPKSKDKSLLRLLLRLHMMRLSAQNQAEAVRALFGFFGPRLLRLTLDKTGNGLPLWQELDPAAVGTDMALRRTDEHIAQRIKGFGFSEKVVVEFDDRELTGKEKPEDAVIEKNVISFAADEMRRLVDSVPRLLELPFDTELLGEWQGQEIEYERDEGSAAGIKTKVKKSAGLHTLDAAFMMIAGRNLLNIEEAMKTVPSGPVLDRFG